MQYLFAGRAEVMTLGLIRDTCCAIEYTAIVCQSVLSIEADTILMELAIPIEDVPDEVGRVFQDLLLGIVRREAAWGVSRDLTRQGCCL